MSADPAGLVKLTSTRFEFEAAIIAEALKARGIPARVFGTAARVGQWEFGINTDTLVMVRRSDLNTARQELAAVEAESSALSDSDLQTSEGDMFDPGMRCRGCGYELTGCPIGPCPECGQRWEESDARSDVEIISRNSRTRPMTRPHARRWIVIALIVAAIAGAMGRAAQLAMEAAPPSYCGGIR